MSKLQTINKDFFDNEDINIYKYVRFFINNFLYISILSIFLFLVISYFLLDFNERKKLIVTIPASDNKINELIESITEVQVALKFYNSVIGLYIPEGDDVKNNNKVNVYAVSFLNFDMEDLRNLYFRQFNDIHNLVIYNKEYDINDLASENLSGKFKLEKKQKFDDGSFSLKTVTYPNILEKDLNLLELVNSFVSSNIIDLYIYELETLSEKIELEKNALLDSINKILEIEKTRAILSNENLLISLNEHLEIAYELGIAELAAELGLDISRYSVKNLEGYELGLDYLRGSTALEREIKALKNRDLNSSNFFSKLYMDEKLKVKLINKDNTQQIISNNITTLKNAKNMKLIKFYHEDLRSSQSTIKFYFEAFILLFFSYIFTCVFYVFVLGYINTNLEDKD